MTDRRKPSWPLLALGAACIAAIVVAILLVGPAPASQTTVERTAKVTQGVVQSTVSGTGNLQPASQLNLGFKTAGTVTHIYVHQGEQVVKGQLLATLDPKSAEVTLQQARAALQSAQASLSSAQESSGESTATTANAAYVTAAAEKPATTPTTTTPTTTTPATAAPTKTTSAPSTSTPAAAPSGTQSGSSTGGGSGSATSGASGGSAVSAATREANAASAEAAVRSDELTVQSDEQAVGDTKLYAPEDGTIATLAGQVGEVVSGGGTTRASSGESSAGSTSSTAAGGSPKAGTGATSSSSSSTSGTTSSFAVLADLSSMRLVAPLSESEVGSVRAGQIATVTVEALEGRKLAAHVQEVSILSTSNSGVVSYDVTFALDQMEAGLKPGMSATAEVVVKQASGLSVPTSAITAGSVTVVAGAKRETRRVTTGLAGNTSTLVLSGLKAGETVALPTATTTSKAGTTGARTRGAGGFAGGGLGGAGGGLGGAGGGAGGGAFLRGGG